MGWDRTGWSKETGVDVTDEKTVRAAVSASCKSQPFDVVINCAGVNYINWHEDTPIEEWDRLMNTNARAPWLVVKELLKVGGIMSPGTVVNIVSNASHVPMTNSAAYNASKGAAHILTLQMNRELKKRHNITVFGVSPNKLRGTAMSEYIGQRVCELRGMTPEEAHKYQLASLPAGEETDPAACAEFIAFLLSKPRRHKYLAGCVLPYGA
jgi:Dehydrogenases with different specificities (related to short-chain alcohol dehydrogenases)